MSNSLLDNNIISHSVVDFEGIENITKFKFRKTKPLYPKPGTFYWVEEDVIINDEINHKYCIYFVNNDKKLLRLDSNMFELIVKNKDNNYIQISDKNELDQQEIYLIIGKYIKEDTINDKGIRVFKITNSNNKGLSTVESTVEYVSDSNNMIYMSNVKDTLTVGKQIGDIRIGYTKNDIKNNTISDILDTIIFPTIQPEIKEPSVKLSNKILTDFFEDVKINNGHIVIKKNQENIDKLNELLNKITDYLIIDRGELSYPTENGEKYYAGEIIEEKKYVPDIISLIDNNNDHYEFSVGVVFDDGLTPLNNKGVRARYEDKIDSCTCVNGCEKCEIPAFKKKEIISNKIIIDVVYPIYTNSINKNDKIIECPTLLNYVQDNGDEICLEFPKEYDSFYNYIENNGTTLINPLKMCICIPEGTNIDVYQYNEFTKDYDISVKMGDFLQKSVKEFSSFDVTNNLVYRMYIRGYDNSLKYKLDTQTQSVKYKIKIKRN